MKGMIADIKGKKAVMLAENGEFITIPNKDYFVGQTVNCRLHSYKHPAAYAAAAAVAAVMCIGGHSAYYMPVSTIDIDINPSIRIEINVFDRVIDIVPLNDDADRLLSVCDKKGGAIDECLDEIIEQSYAMGYLNETNNSIEMDVISTHKRPHEAAEKYNGGMSLNGMNITAAIEKADREELKKAKELNISVGRLRAIDEYSVEYGGNEESNAEKLKDISTKEIKKRTEAISSANINSGKSALAEKSVDKTSKSENERGNTDKNNDVDNNVKTSEKVKYTDVIKASPRSIDNVNKSAGTAGKSSAVSVSRPEFKTLPSNTSQSTAENSEIKNSEDLAKSYDSSKSVNEDKPNISKPEFEEISTKPDSEQTSDNTEEKSENEAVTMPAEKEEPVIEVPDFTNKDNWLNNDKKTDKTDKPDEDKKEDKSEENSSSDNVNKNNKVPENKDEEKPSNGDNNTLKPNEDNKNNSGSADKDDSSGNNKEKPDNSDNKTDSGKNEFEKPNSSDKNDTADRTDEERPNNSDNKNNTADKTDNGRNDDGKSDNLKPNDKNNEEKPDNSNKTEIIDKPQNPNGGNGENDKPKNDGTNNEPAQRPQNPNNGGNKADSTQDNKGSGRDNQSQSPSGGNADRPQNPNPGQSKGQPNGSGSGGASLSGDSGGHTGNERSSSGNSL